MIIFYTLNIIFLFFLPYIYRLFFIKIFKTKNTPKGYSFIFIIYIYLIGLYINVIEFSFLHFILIILTSLYWLDDLFHLKIYQRIFLIFLSSIAVFIINDLTFFEFFLVFLLIFILSNSINFMDGADLNLFIIIVTYVLFLNYIGLTKITLDNILINLFIISLIGFGIYNYFPNKIYFGDSGCFFLAVIITLWFFDPINNNLDYEYILFPLIFIIIDVVYVIILRLLRRENIFTRNYLHLYQVIQNKTKNKLYLLLYPINIAFLILITYLIKNLILSDIIFFEFFIIITFNIIYYFSIRIFYENYK